MALDALRCNHLAPLGFEGIYALVVVQLDLYTAVNVSSLAILLGVVARVVLQRPRRRSVARRKARSWSSTSSWSARCARSSPRLHAAVVVVYILLRVVHALLLTFSVTSLLVQVISQVV